MPGGGSISGQANIVFDDDGWYFACGGLVITMPSNPYVTSVSLALLFGDYPISNEQPIKDVFTNILMMAVYRMHLQIISGFYFDGKLKCQFLMFQILNWIL
ncbi:MAG: hypothetical protein IPL12_08175 [Bacteroidetes bacterium]|nr:hypothetical protein [Bacteroidota bacterium]